MRFDELRVTAIFFWGRSGSVFLHSLFDSHPEVLTMPASRLNAFHAREWPKLAREPEIADMARRFVELNPSLFDGRQDRWFEGLDAMGPGRDTALWVDAAAFVRELSRLLAPPAVVTRRRFFLAAHVAYALARGEDVSRKTTIIYHLHSPEAYANIEAALDDFPDLRAIGITREPIRSTLSYLRKNVLGARAWGQADRSSYAQLVPTGGFNAVYRHQLIGWRELVARYSIPFQALRIEDLNRDTEGQMRALAAFVGISFQPCLLESTFNGLAYGGDRLAVGQSRALDVPAPSEAESDAALDRLDRYVLRGLLANFRREFGYGDTPASQRWLAPLLLLLPTRLERLSLAASLREAAAQPASSRRSAVAALRHVVARHRFCYRHLFCEAFPGLRPFLPLPEPLGPGLRLPARQAPSTPAADAAPSAREAARPLTRERASV